MQNLAMIVRLYWGGWVRWQRLLLIWGGWILLLILRLAMLALLHPPPIPKNGLDYWTISLRILGSIGIGLAIYSARIGWKYHRWRTKTWPAALKARAAEGTVLEIRLPPDSTTPAAACRDLHEHLFLQLQTDLNGTQGGQAITPAWEIWSGPRGTGFYCWLPAHTTPDQVSIIRQMILATYPRSRVRKVADPVRAQVAPPLDPKTLPPAGLLGIQTFKLRAPAHIPIRDGEQFQTDPLAQLRLFREVDARRRFSTGTDSHPLYARIYSEGLARLHLRGSPGERRGLCSILSYPPHPRACG